MKTEIDHIPNVYRALIGHFTTRGLTPGEIEKLFEDAFNILGQGRAFTMTGLNRRLESMGWRNGIVDKISFRLIMCLLEKDAPP